MLKAFHNIKYFNRFIHFRYYFFSNSINSLMSLRCFLYTTIKVDILPGMVFAKIVNLPSICVGGFLFLWWCQMQHTWC